MEPQALPSFKCITVLDSVSTPLLVQTDASSGSRVRSSSGSSLPSSRKLAVAILAGAFLCASAIIIWWHSLCPTSASALCSTCKIEARCSSDFVNSESGNFRGWELSTKCEHFVKTYIEHGQFACDISDALALARSYYTSIPLNGDGRDVIVLDIDETSLSNMPYYELHHYGAEKFDPVKWNTWVLQSAAIAIEPTLRLYRDLQAMGYKMAFITGRSDDQRNATVANLVSVGYADWLDLHMREPWEGNQTAEDYKSRRRQALEERGYRIWGGLGDQWSDIKGPASGNRTFKLPNPMYYIA